jgi:hypothetical protein
MTWLSWTVNRLALWVNPDPESPTESITSEEEEAFNFIELKVESARNVILQDPEKLLG